MNRFAVNTRNSNLALGLFTLALAVASAGCGGSEPIVKSVDEQFGHRYDGTAPDGRETQLITAPDAGTSYFYYPAVYDTVHIRPERIDNTTRYKIELLVKGSFPDSCTDLNSVKQTKIEHVINMSLDMRRPKGVVCASVMRPYRFYVLLDGEYESGHYTLKLNNRANTFVVAPVTE